MRAIKLLKIIAIVICFNCLWYELSAQQSSGQVKRDTVYQDRDDVLAEYRKEMNEDMVAHRDYITHYYERVYNTGLGLALIIAAILTVFGIRTLKDVKELLVKSLNNRMDSHINKRLEMEIAKSLSARGIDKAQNWNLVRDLEMMYKKLSSEVADQYIIENADTIFEYIEKDGSEVKISSYQNIKVLSQTIPLEYIDKFLNVASPGTIQVISTQPGFRSLEDLSNKKDLRLEFSDPLGYEETAEVKLSWKVFGGFTDHDEWYEVFQINPIHKDSITVKFLKDRICKHITCYRVHTNNNLERLNLAFVDSIDDTHKCYKMELPVENTPAKYRIAWKF